MHNTRTIRHEWWQLRMNEAKHNRLFDMIGAVNDDALDQRVPDANAGSSASFAPTHKDDEAGPSGTIIDLSSTSDIEPGL